MNCLKFNLALNELKRVDTPSPHPKKPTPTNPYFHFILFILFIFLQDQCNYIVTAHGTPFLVGRGH